MSKMHSKSVPPNKKNHPSSMVPIKLSQDNEKNIVEKIVRASKEVISKRIVEERFQAIVSKINMTEREKQSLYEQLEAEEKENLVKSLLENYKDHTLKCGLMTIADMKINSDSKTLESYMKFQINFFAQRGIEPSETRVKLLFKCVKSIVTLYAKRAVYRQTVKNIFFMKWYLKVFGFRREMTRLVIKMTQEGYFEDVHKKKIMDGFLSYRNKKRFMRKISDAFTRWKLMVKYGFPMYSRRQRYMAVLPHIAYRKNELIKDKNKELRRYDTRIKRVSKHINQLKLIDNCEVLSKVSRMFYLIRKRIHSNYEWFFTSYEVLRFPFENQNIKVLQKKLTTKTTENVPVSLLVPYVFVQQILIFCYRCSLRSALRKLQFQVRLSDKEKRLNNIQEEIVIYRHRARFELMIQIYLRSCMKVTRKFLMRWHFQSQLRKATHLLGNSVSAQAQLTPSKEQELFRQIKLSIEGLAESKTGHIVQVLSKSLNRDPQEMVDWLGGEIEGVVGGLLDIV